MNNSFYIEFFNNLKNFFIIFDITFNEFFFICDILDFRIRKIINPFIRNLINIKKLYMCEFIYPALPVTKIIDYLLHICKFQFSQKKIMHNLIYWSPCLGNVGTIKSTINSASIL